MFCLKIFQISNQFSLGTNSYLIQTLTTFLGNISAVSVEENQSTIDTRREKKNAKQTQLKGRVGNTSINQTQVGYIFAEDHSEWI